jgi:pimeloyl-ACP methyl ester carboxylesterase
MYLHINGNRLFALSFGSGPRTFLAHSGWVGNFEDWIATLSLLSEDWRVIVYDHRGAGESEVPVARITADGMIEDVFAVMDAFEVPRCTLAGFSAGTAIALRAAVRAPERFEGLMLLNGSGGVRHPKAAPKPRIPPSQWPGARHEDRIAWFAAQCTPEPDAAHIRRWAINLLSRATPHAAEAAFRTQPSEVIDWAHALPRLDLPTLLVHGDLDPFVDIADMTYLDGLLPQSALIMMEGSGHLPAMTKPQGVARAINAFFGV